MRFTPTAALVVLMIGVCAAPAFAGKVIDNGRHGDIDKVNGDIEIGKNSEAGDLETVNGDIEVDDGSKVGQMETVNGDIELGANVSGHSAETVNGSITGKNGTVIQNEVETVNGGIRFGDGSSARQLETVNGTIELVGTHIAKDIETVNGNIEISGNSSVDGAIIFRKPSGWGWGNNKKPKLTLKPGVVVGSVILEREVELDIEGAKVGKIDRRYDSK